MSSSALTIQASDYDAFDALLHQIYSQTQTDNWFKPTLDALPTGVCLRVSPGVFRLFPYENPLLLSFEENVRRLNPTVAVKIRSASVHAALRKLAANPPQNLELDHNTHIQILPALSSLPSAEKDQNAAFILSDLSLVLWTYNSPEGIIESAAEFEEKLIKYIWRTRGEPNRVRDLTINVGVGEGGNTPGVWTPGTVMSSSGSQMDVGLVDEKESSKAPAAPAAVVPPKSGFFSWLRPSKPPKPVTSDAEKVSNDGLEAPRKQILLGPFYAACGVGIAAFFATGGIKVLLQEHILDDTSPTRFLLVLTLPIIFCVSIFFCLQLVGNISLIFGPVAQVHENSKYYSAIEPEPNPIVDNNLPHITIQLPVYKESLEQTIAPSVFSVKTAMRTYARQGGTSAIFICDDGLQLLSPEDRKERIDFYANHNIAWTARPGHNGKDPLGFKRAGKFKKASNMNYGLALSVLLEKHLAKLIADGETDDPSAPALKNGSDYDVPAASGMTLEDKALALAIAEVWEETGHMGDPKWKPWASNGKSARMGEIVLIIDADTIVPEDCFRAAAREMYASPALAIIQHESDVMQVAHHYFENGITHFTRRINRCISYGCSNGEVAPFVGHNAFLRWSAMQDASFIETLPGGKPTRKIWSEANVSEDFDIALRLLLRGYDLRWATYSNGGFKEGVSLTIVDELARWQKYAYGCSEIIFNPFSKWLTRGPISKQLHGFVWSKAPLHYKVGMQAYMFSYYGISAAIVGSTLNYLLLAFAPSIDKFYLKSFEIFLACTVVFPGLGNVGFTLLEYRMGHRTLGGAIYENLRWVPFFTFFFGGMSIHLSTATLAHLVGYDMTWGSTGKEVEKSTFFIEVPRIFRTFWLTLSICFLLSAMMVIFSTELIPATYRIPGSNWAQIIPLAMTVGSHVIMPIVLNPWLMKFSF